MRIPPDLEWICSDPIDPIATVTGEQYLDLLSCPMVLVSKRILSRGTAEAKSLIWAIACKVVCKTAGSSTQPFVFENSLLLLEVGGFVQLVKEMEAKRKLIPKYLSVLRPDDLLRRKHRDPWSNFTYKCLLILVLLSRRRPVCRLCAPFHVVGCDPIECYMPKS